MNERGAVLSFVLMVVGVLSVVAMAMAALVRVDTMQEVALENVTKNFLAAEAGINRGIGEFRNIFLGQDLPQPADFEPKLFAIDGHNVRYQLWGIPTTPPPSRQVTLPAGDVFAGLNSVQYRYSVRSDDLHTDSSSRAGLGAQFTVNNVPIFQFLFFYTNDLEFEKPAPMALHGRIHSNRDLYLDASAPVSVGDSPQVPIIQVSAGRTMYRGGNPTNANSTGCTGTFTVDSLAGDPLPIPCNGSGTRVINQAEAAAWGGSLLPGLGNITPPGIDRVLQDAWERAELRLALRLTSTDKLDNAACQSLAPLKAIEVLDAAGGRNAPLTARLERFAWERPGKIFYNDVPDCPSRDYDTCAKLPARYVSRPFATASSVYRRADDGTMDPQWAANRCDYRRGGFFNNREKRGPFRIPTGQGSWMYLLNIDLQALLDWNRAQPPGDRLFDPDDATDGGIVIYATVIGPASDGINNYGVRLFDSRDLGFVVGGPDPTGVTVVSNQAVYVEGDYNTVDKAPAAVIGDSVNVLSQNWESGLNDGKSARGLAERKPAATTINAALIAGVDANVAASSNGGVNNYLRLHEAWQTGPVVLAYQGSMVSLAEPAHANGYFLTSGPGPDIYTAPIRNWDYDFDFNDAAKLPPLTPRVVWVQQALFTQQFQ